LGFWRKRKKEKKKFTDPNRTIRLKNALPFASLQCNMREKKKDFFLPLTLG
jgi:hypothetical protein